jgi:hypothetical protein
MQYGWQVPGYAKILFQVYRHLGMAVKADFEAGAALVRVVERDVKLFHTLLCAWSRAKGMDIYVKMFSLVYMALTLGVGLVAVSVLFRVCRQRPDEARFRRLGRFFVSYSLVNIILISDFLLRHLFTVRYYFIYSLFLGLVLLYTIGLTIFTYAALILELTDLNLPKVAGKVWFVAVFFPLYLLIPAMKQAKVIADLNWVYQISMFELGILLLVALMILVRYHRRIPEPWTKVAVFLVVLAGAGLPVAVLDNSLGGLAYFYV